jgi:hypothetical protein
MALNYLQGMAGRFGRGANTLGTMEDPRARFAQQLQAESVDTSPAFLGTGLSRLGKALVGALMMKRSMADQEAATKWLTSKMPDRTRPPTDQEVFGASPELDALQQAAMRGGPDISQPPARDKFATRDYENILGDFRERVPDTDDVLMGKTEVDEFGEPTGIPKTLEQLNFLNYMQEQHKDFPEQTEFTYPATGETDTATAEDFAKLPGLIDEGSRKFAEQMEQARQESMRYRPRDYAQELATGMEAYRADPMHQISDPYTRMEWLRESAQGLEGNPFVSRMLQNLTLADIGREEEIAQADRAFGRSKQLKQMEIDARDPRTTNEKDFDRAQKDPEFQKWKEKFASTKRPAAAIQYWNQRKKMIQNNASPEDLARFDSYVRADKVIDTGGEIQIRSGVAPGVSTPTTIEKTVPPQQKPEHFKEVERNKYIGKQMGEAQLNYPDLVIDTEYRIELLDKALSHPGLEGVVGIPSIAGAVHAPGTPEANFRVLMAQIEGANFLQAFQGLKGGGHITEIEGEQAKQSLARMAVAQNEEEFKVALLELQALLRRGLMKAGIRSRGGVAPQNLNNKNDDPLDLGL